MLASTLRCHQFLLLIKRIKRLMVDDLMTTIRTTLNSNSCYVTLFTSNEGQHSLGVLLNFMLLSVESLVATSCTFLCRRVCCCLTNLRLSRSRIVLVCHVPRLGQTYRTWLLAHLKSSCIALSNTDCSISTTFNFDIEVFIAITLLLDSTFC